MEMGKAKGMRRGSSNKCASLEGKHHKLCNLCHRPLHGGFCLERRYTHETPLLPLPLSPPLLIHLPQMPLLPLPHNPWAPPLFKKPSGKDPSFLLPSPQAVSKIIQPRAGSNPVKRNNFCGEMKPSKPLVAALRPDPGGADGSTVCLLANHFLVQFDPLQKIVHYDVDISPRPSKEVSRLIKNKLVEENSEMLSGAVPVFDGRKNLYSPIEFQNDKLEFFVTLPIPMAKAFPNEDRKLVHEKQRHKVFKVSVKLASKMSGEDLNKYLKEEREGIPLPQDYLHALDVVLREGHMENCIYAGRSIYPATMGGGEDIGGGAVGLRGFFQSLRPTRQGLSLNVDFSVTAFHESICVISYLEKRCEFLKDLPNWKTRGLVGDEKKEVEKALKNVRIFVCHRETDQRYRVYSLTDEATEKLKFRDRDGRDLMLVDYYKDQYNHDIQFKKLPCLQISRTKPCYLPMELCMLCEGQKFQAKLSDEQTAKIIKMSCQKPGERRDIINGIMGGAIGPTSSPYASEFKLKISKEMTHLYGRVLEPPKLKLGDGGQVRDLTPSRYDRQWNLLDSHVAEGARIKRWALISFGGTSEQRSCISRFMNKLSIQCEQLGIFLNRTTTSSPVFEQIQVLNNVSALDYQLRKIHEAASKNLQLLICIMEKKHRGYADLKRIAETGIGMVTQCCLYSNLTRLSSQFLSNLALKINAKLGGCNVTLYKTLPCQIPRLFSNDEPVIFMGADVTHPHPLDDCSPSVAAVVGSMNWPSANKYISRMRSQTHRQEIIEDLQEMVGELLEEFLLLVQKLPSRIIFFRDGVSETQFYKVLKEELQAIRAACSKFCGYKPLITFTVVQKRHHTRLFLKENCSTDKSIPPGTVVDTVITHPREFDFYLCSHWGVKGTSRPTHYHVLWDENNFMSSELQNLINNLCYTFVRCTKPVSIVPPAYYAHLAAYRGRLYLERSEILSISPSTLSRTGPVYTTPLPKLRDSVKKLMFYC